MKNQKKSPILLLIVLMLSSFTYAEGINFQDLTLEEGIAKAKKENKKLFIDVYATWCGPCKYLTKNVFVDDDLGAFINEHFVALKLDGERDDGLVLMGEFELDSYPTMLFLDTDRKLMKKIVGAVGAEAIKASANAVVFPESTVLFKLQKKYDEGNRDRVVLSDLVMAQLEGDIETEALVGTFLELFPKVDMADENEFIIFCLGVNDKEDKRLKAFLKDIDFHIENHGSMVATKVIMMMFNDVELAVEQKDISLIRKSVEELYPYFNKADSDAPDLDEMVEHLEGVYSDS
jgi:thioredoxin-related protein